MIKYCTTIIDMCGVNVVSGHYLIPESGIEDRKCPQCFSAPIWYPFLNLDGKTQQRVFVGFWKTYPLIPNTKNLRKDCDF